VKISSVINLDLFWKLLLFYNTKIAKILAISKWDSGAVFTTFQLTIGPIS
jgi:hypothetical protein